MDLLILAADSDYPILKVIGTLMFVAIFLGVVIWLLVSRKDEFEKTSQIPLQDEPVEDRLADRKKQPDSK